MKVVPERIAKPPRPPVLGDVVTSFRNGRMLRMSLTATRTLPCLPSGSRTSWLCIHDVPMQCTACTVSHASALS